MSTGDENMKLITLLENKYDNHSSGINKNKVCNVDVIL